MTPTKIEWADEVWNPVTGCEKVSPGCDHCYAERVTERFHGKGSFAKVTLHPDRLDQPLRWRTPKRVFVNSMSDLFHDEVPDEYIAKVFAVMALEQRHTFQILTKRHARMRSLLSSDDFQRAVAAEWLRHPKRVIYVDRFPRWPLPNVWLGVSVESQQWADIRVPALLDTPAVVRFLSCEPLLGPVDLSRIPNGIRLDGGPRRDSALIEACPDCGGWGGAPCNADGYHFVKRHGGIDWVIVGGESGAGARPMHPQWAQDLRDQCVSAGVPFFFKQWGEWVPEDQSPEDTVIPASFFRDDTTGCMRLGKHKAGRLLDGRTWDEYPEACGE